MNTHTHIFRKAFTYLLLALTAVSVFSSSIPLSRAVGNAELPDPVEPPIQITDSYSHVQGTITDLPNTTQVIRIRLVTEDGYSAVLCGQIVQVGDEVIAQDTLDTGIFDLVCNRPIEANDQFVYILELQTALEDNTVTTYVYPLATEELVGDPIVFSQPIPISEFESDSSNSAAWTIEFDNQTSGYNYAFLSPFGPYYVEEVSDYYMFLAIPVDALSLSSGTNTLYPILGETYYDYMLESPSLALFFASSDFQTVGIYQFDPGNITIDYNNTKITVNQAITNDEIITSTEDFNTKIADPDGTPISGQYFSNYFQSWSTWYATHSAAIETDESFIESAMSNLVIAPTDLDGNEIPEMSDINIDFLTKIKVKTHELYVTAVSQGLAPWDAHVPMRGGKNAFEKALSLKPDSQLLQKIQETNLFGTMENIVTRIQDAIENLEALNIRILDMFVEKAYAGPVWHFIGKVVDYSMTIPVGMANAAIAIGNTVGAVIGGENVIDAANAAVTEFENDMLEYMDWNSKSTLEGGGVISQALGAVFSTVIELVFSILNAILAMIGNLLLVVLGWMVKLVAWILGLNEANNITNDNTIIYMWGKMRDLANYAFILIFLFIAGANIAQYQADTYVIKKILPKTVFALIIINFSKVFVYAVLKFADLLEAAVYALGGMGPHGYSPAAAAGSSIPACTAIGEQTNLAGLFGDLLVYEGAIGDKSLACKFSALFKVSTWASMSGDKAGGLSEAGFFLLLLVMNMFLIFLIIAFLALFVLFTFRIIVLWLLTALSPLYFASKPIPFLESVAGKWKDNFFKYAFVHVYMAFYLTLSVLMLEGENQNWLSGISSEEATKINQAFFFDDLLKLIFFMVLVFLGITTALKTGEHVSFITDKIKGAGIAAAKWAGGSVPVLPRITETPDGKKHLGFMTARNVGGGIHHAYEAVKHSFDSRHETVSGDVAEKLLHGANKIVPGKFLKDRLQLGSAELRQTAEHKAAEQKRASELKGGMKDMTEQQLYKRLESANNPDEIRAILETLTDKGAYQATKVALALKISNKFSKDRQEALKKDDGQELSVAENRTVEESLAKLTGEKEYASNLEAQSQNNFLSRAKNKTGIASQAAHHTEDFVNMIEEAKKTEGASLERDKLFGSFQYSIEQGKSSPHEVITALCEAVGSGKVSRADAKWIANRSGWSNQFPDLELFADEGMMTGGKNMEKGIEIDGKKVSALDAYRGEYAKAMELRKAYLAKGENDKARDALREVVQDPGGNFSTIAEHVYQNSDLVRSRYDKTANLHDKIAALDPDWGSYVLRKQGAASRIRLAQKASGDKGKLNDSGKANTFQEDHNSTESLKKVLSQAKAGGDPKEVVRVQKEIKSLLERIAATDLAFTHKEMYGQYGTSADTIGKSQYGVKAPNSGKKMGDLIAGHDEVLSVIVSGGTTATVDKEGVMEKKKQAKAYEKNIILSGEAGSTNPVEILRNGKEMDFTNSADGDYIEKIFEEALKTRAHKSAVN